MSKDFHIIFDALQLCCSRL